MDHKIKYMSNSTKKIISQITLEIKGKELFPKQIEAAKKILKNIKSLPI